MIKFYIPAGHLEDSTLNLLKQAGFKVNVKSRDYLPKIDDPNFFLKKIRPQDIPFVISLGKGDIAITGGDILKDFKLSNFKSSNIKVLLNLPINKTKLVLAISRRRYPGITSISKFVKLMKKKKEKIIVASEYPHIAKEYLRKLGITNFFVVEPAGKTEAWILPPLPEADMIIDTAETGYTLSINDCLPLDVVYESSPVFIANKESYSNKDKRDKINKLIQLFEGVIYAKGMVNVWMNVLKEKDLDNVINVIKEYVNNPTISKLMNGGYDIFIIIKENYLRELLPKLIKVGATAIAVTNTRMLIKGKQDFRK